MPIVDDPYNFGRIASANAISDVYAMGGKPILAIAILAWPIHLLDSSVAAQVLDGARSICAEAGIPLAGGHSIDSPEPIFGLAVNGIVLKNNIKRNSGAKEGDLLFLTKPLGVGILTTAEKKGLLKAEHENIAATQMMKLNKLGEKLGEKAFVHAMTDVTGFGLLGHLLEMCEGSDVSASLKFSDVPEITQDLQYYIDHKSIPGGTLRNWDSYGSKIEIDTDLHAENVIAILADPQTSGGLLIAIDKKYKEEFEQYCLMKESGTQLSFIGEIKSKKVFPIKVF
jgi:selenide,water dikinase